MDKTTELQNLNDSFYRTVTEIREGSVNSLSFNIDVLESLIDDMREILIRIDHVWFDVDAKYYNLGDTDKTPMVVKWIKDGDIRLESECGDNIFSGSLNGIEDWIAKLPSQN